ncbi:hypothetical protein [Nocardioides ferulae]|uniref:hypothetical protein n=1 Tax=Nocardioides ferulae TaxID=2340821 RepID=UPI000EAC17F5|nr:hypothetical protein [Nocardioides ferulae]
MSTRIQQAASGALTASAFYVGGWGTFAPRSFYDDFPGLNRAWVGGDGPFNEHLVRDIGSLYLALGVAGVLALRWRQRAATTMLGAAWVVFSVPHLAYHVGHVGHLPEADAVAVVVTLALTLLLALLALLPTRTREER